MKSFSISSTILWFLILTACALPAPEVTVTQTVTSLPSETPTPTETPESTLPTEIQEKLDKAGIKLEDLGTPEKDGLHITLESGEAVITYQDLNKNSYLGQNNVWQYRNTENTQVLYAFDKENKTLLEASKYIQTDKTDPEKYIQVANWDELKALWEKEKMFLIPFDAENTYFPPLDKINRDYADRKNLKPGSEFDFYRPFGTFPVGMDSPFRFVNFTRMQKDASDGRPLDSYIISEQVFNPDDGTFSMLHFYVGEGKVHLQIIEQMTENGKFLLPRFELTNGTIGNPPDLAHLNYLRENGLLVDNDQMPLIQELVYQWFETGHIPQELEDILCSYKDNKIK